MEINAWKRMDVPRPVRPTIRTVYQHILPGHKEKTRRGAPGAKGSPGNRRR